MRYKPIEIARRLQLSTSALRHYESWGAIPAPERAPNGYRIYTDEHLAYFECLRAMGTGYGMAVAVQALKLIQQGSTDQALWLVHEQQALLHQDKQLADKTLHLLGTVDGRHEPETRRGKRGLTIGQVTLETGVPGSAIRHWEKTGLITLERDQSNGYRRIMPEQVKLILLIRTLRTAVYSLDVIRETVRAYSHNETEPARRVTQDALAYLNHRGRQQAAGYYHLVRLCQILGQLDR